MYQQIGIFLVLLLCAGVACIVMGWKDRRDPTAPTRQRRRRSSSKIPRSTQILLVVGFAAGIVVSSLSVGSSPSFWSRRCWSACRTCSAVPKQNSRSVGWRPWMSGPATCPAA